MENKIKGIITAHTLLSKTRPYNGAHTVNTYRCGEVMNIERIEGDWAKISDFEYAYIPGNIEIEVENEEKEDEDEQID